MSGGSPVIEIKNLTKTFPSADGTFYALKNVSLTINDGEIYGIIGMSGAGKSTLVRCINMLERPTEGAVLVGMVYNFLPFMVLPIYTVLIKLDRRLIEAAQDLDAPTHLVFRRVIVPLSIPGVISGITMVFVPSVSTFVISQMLGSGKNLLIGDLIDLQFMGGAYNPHLGSAIALVMMLLIFLCMWIMNKFDDGSGEEGGLLL